MGDSENNNKNDLSQEFSIKSELSALVAKNVIPSRIADKLSNKIEEKNVTITKEQLYKLVDKITSVMQTYGKVNQTEDTKKVLTPSKKVSSTETNENMQKLVESIEKLEKRLTNIENDLLDFDKKTSTKFVKTDDVRLPKGSDVDTSTDWVVEPLKDISNDPESIVVLMKWLQYLIDKCGRSNLSNILDYYVDIGWVSQDAKLSLIEYSHGITEENKKPEGVNTKDVNDLPSRDHIQSFIFIQKLKGKNVDKHFIQRVDSELNRLTKKIDNYNFK